MGEPLTRGIAFHSTLIVLEIILWVSAGLAGWLDSVAFVSHLSMAALVLASLSALQGAFASREASSPCNHCGN